nr:integrase, catalytic region, zinc finger, CCHC-type, peptidase aspartic, catalytic [Tanacetum cinerariifolium]
MSSRAQLTGRITALIAKNATLKPGVKGKQNSGPTQPEKPKWKPIGQTFSLYATYPLTKIANPLTEPLDQTQSISPSTNASRISRLPDSNLRDRKAGSEGITRYSRHMTGDRSKLINYMDKFICTVRFKNDEFATIVGYGDYKLGDTIITRVYYVEGLKHNLFSIEQFCDADLEESSVAGTDNRAPMLEENDYKSWKIRMKRYIRSKPQGKAIWKSIVEGPAPHPMTAAVTGVANVVVEALRPKRDEEFTVEENVRDLANIQAASIPSQGSGLSEQRKQEELFDEYERFYAIGNESIHEYFIRFHKPANDLKITKIKIPTHQQNTKFLNNLPSYWAKYVTSVKQNQDISTKSYVELYTYLKAYEPHALKTLKKQEQSSSNVDPLAYLDHSSKHQTSTILVNLLSGFQKQFPPTNNQLRTSSNPRSYAMVHEGQIVTETVQRKAPGNVSNAGTKGNQGYGKKTDSNGKKVICYNCRGEGHVARKCKEPKRAKDTQYYKDKIMMSDAKDRGVILDAEAEAFLADDAYDSDIDDGPHAAAAFMANLSSTKEANGTSSSKINEDLDERNLEEIVCLQKANRVVSDLLKTYQQPTHTIHMLSKCSNIATSDLHKTALGSSNSRYGNIDLESHPAIYDSNRLLDPTHVPISIWETEETIALGAESRAKMFEKPGTVKPINYDVLNNSYIQFVPQKELSYEQVYWQSASVVKALFVHTRLAKKVLVKEVKEFEKIFDELDDEYEQRVQKIKSLEITNKNLVHEIECLTSDSIANDVCAIVHTTDVRMPLDAKISSSCVRELSKGLELEAEIAKKNKMLSESKK